MCKLTIKFLSERIGSIQQDVGFTVNRLQLLQSGLPPTDALHTQTDSNLMALLFSVVNCVEVSPCAAAAPYLALRPESGLLQPRPDALDPAGVLRVAVGVAAHTLVLLHQRVVHQT